MFDAGWLNIGSLVLGLISLILPIINLMKNNKQEHKNWVVLSIISISACAISVCFQIFYQNYLVKIEDWSAIMDTMGSVAFVSAVLLIVTIILNVITLIVYRGRKTISSL
ncbi:hypothetical protein [Priestia megaterium]|uniref:hypothetical protein n=1 Tax=Priestia megaterium TaxID=1404 RepID=UPI001C2376E1|nr:hypothetical protein [Priestia megaterium]MBU8852764.1 hypothetical protein [Bacillus sp. FJAT-26377]MCU7738879.1 hypothetical protein [Priestia megaterium]